MTIYWSIDGRYKDGQSFLHLPHETAEEIEKLIAVALRDPRTGGIVIYRPTVAPSNEGDKDNRHFTYCRYCLTTGGHTADCSVIA